MERSIRPGSNNDKREALNRIGVALKDVKRATLLASDDEIASLLAEYSHVLKMTSTYGDNLLKKINKETGRIYPRFAQMGSDPMAETEETIRKLPLPAVGQGTLSSFHVSRTVCMLSCLMMRGKRSRPTSPRRSRRPMLSLSSERKQRMLPFQSR